jgi:hypothetical protein
MASNVTSGYPYDVYPYALFSRLRGWDKGLYPTLEYATAIAESRNQGEKWHERYPPHEVDRCLKKYQGDIYSEATLNAMLKEVAIFQEQQS